MDGTPWAEWTPGSEAPVFEPGAPGWGRRLPIGAEIRPEGGVDFRVWAPDRHRVEIAIESGPGARGRRPFPGRIGSGRGFG